MKPEIGQVVHGRFRIEGLLARGGLGWVFIANDLVLNRPVVLKTVAHRSDYQRALLLREGRIMASLHHPALVAWLDTFLEGDLIFIVQELVEGGERLTEWQVGRSRVEVLQLYAELADGVAALHTQGVIHRDLKPDNVLVVRRSDTNDVSLLSIYRPVIVDFGLAVATDEPDHLTGVGTTLGTIAYTSPESILGAELGAGADVFSLGVMLLEALRGQGDSSQDLWQILAARARGEIAPDAAGWLAELQPRELAAAVRSMLATDPQARPSAAEVAASLRNLALSAVNPLFIVSSKAKSLRPGPDLQPASLKLEMRLQRAGALAAAPSPSATPARRSHSRPLLFAGVAILFATALLVAHSVLQVTPGPAAWPPPRPPRYTVKPYRGDLLLSANLHRIGLLLPVSLLLGIGGLAWLSWIVIRARRVPDTKPAAEMSDEDLARRLVAIEERVQASADVTQSVVVRLQEISHQVDPESLARLVKASVVAALQDFAAARELPRSKLVGAIDALRQLEPKPERESWPKRLTSYLGIAGSSVAALVGTTGVILSTDLWHPSHAPHIVSIGPPEIRLTTSSPTFLSVVATDPDGGPLTYSFRASAGRVEGRGNSVLWTPPADLHDRLVELKVAVRNHDHASELSRSLLVNHPPTIELSVPQRATRRSVVMLRAAVRDPDGDPTKIAWKVSCGQLQGAAGETVFWRTSDRPCRAIVICEADDGWERRSASATVIVE